MKFPRFTKEQNRACKLDDWAIVEIKRMYKMGFPAKFIAAYFEVSVYTIYYWLLSEAKRKERNKEQYLRCDQYQDIDKKREKQSRSLYRKYRIQPEFKKYLLSLRKKQPRLKVGQKTN